MHILLSCSSAPKSSATEIKRLLGVINQATRAFTSLKRPIEYWDDWFVHLLISKLDSHMRLYCETSLADSREIPIFAQLQEFLETRIRVLGAAHPETTLSRSSVYSSKQTKSARLTPLPPNQNQEESAPCVKKRTLWLTARSLKGCSAKGRITKKF